MTGQKWRPFGLVEQYNSTKIRNENGPDKTILPVNRQSTIEQPSYGSRTSE